MGILGMFGGKTHFLKPFLSKTMPDPQQKARNAELEVKATRNQIDLMKLDREKKLFKP